MMFASDSLRRRACRGASVVELLVVVFILASLAGLLFPAVQHAREQARIATCTSHLRQISLGCLEFESARRCFPSAIVGHDARVAYVDWISDAGDQTWRNRSFVSSLGMILPMLDLAALQDTCDRRAFEFGLSLRQAGFDSLVDIPGLVELAEQDVPLFQCPSDGVTKEDAVVLFQPCFHEGGHAIAFRNASEIELSQTLGKTNYSACYSAVSSMDHLQSINSRDLGIFDITKRVTAREVNDGLSKTILFAESIGDAWNGSQRTSVSWLLHATAVSLGPVSWPSLDRFDEYPQHPVLGDPRNSANFGFGSAHSHISMISFGDGRVEPVTRDVEPRVLYFLAGRDNGSNP